MREMVGSGSQGDPFISDVRNVMFWSCLTPSSLVTATSTEPDQSFAFKYPFIMLTSYISGLQSRGKLAARQAGEGKVMPC